MYKKRYASRNIRGKLRVCRLLSANRVLKHHVPRTVSFNRAHLGMMMSAYKMIYVKPDVGSLGKGIFKLKRVDSGYELFQIINKKQIKNHYGSKLEVFQGLKKSRSTKLIIQQGINLDQVNDCPYDIRVMVQRKPKGSWVCTGFMVKVGGKEKIVTNYFQGGTIYSMEKLGKEQGLSSAQTAKRISKLKETALQISHTLSQKRSGMHEMGIDFAFDNKQKLWVLEVNSNHPQFHPLKKLDRKAYNRMMRFAVSYGRRDAK